MSISRIAVISAIRTPIGRYLGGLSGLSAVELGITAAVSALEAAKISAEDVDFAYFGHARQAGSRPNPARQIAIGAGLREETYAATLNMACASGMKAIQSAADDLALGRGKVALVGGVESMSQVPFLLTGMRSGYRLGHAKVIDNMYQDGFHCPLADMIMGETVDFLAKELNIGRFAQDDFALSSQLKAKLALDEGHFEAEIVGVEVATRKGVDVVREDEHPRPETSREKLQNLPPVFDSESGTVTAGNASGITDGAAALIMMTEAEAEVRGLDPIAFLSASYISGTHPKRMGLGPVFATQGLLQRQGWGLADFGLFEINEAFAAQVLACQQQLGIPSDLLNVNGGSIALGHPIGCTGARITVTLLHAMKNREISRGLATLCVSGGMGMTTAWELAS